MHIPVSRRVKKGARSGCNNLRGASLNPIVTKVFTSMLLCHLTPLRESSICEQQAGFLLGRGCTDQFYSSPLTQNGAYTPLPCNRIFSGLQDAFDSMDRTMLFSSVHLKGTLEKFVNLPQQVLSKRGRIYSAT